MDDATANGLRIGGALLAVFALALPWWTVRAGTEITSRLGGDPSLDSVSGWEGLGVLRWVILAAAAVVALRLAAPQLQALAAVGLLLVIGIRWSTPPSVTDAVVSSLPDSGGGVGDALGRAMLEAITDKLGLELRPSHGMALAAAGAVAALVGAWQTAPAPAARPVPARSPIG